MPLNAACSRGAPEDGTKTIRLSRRETIDKVEEHDMEALESGLGPQLADDTVRINCY